MFVSNPSDAVVPRSNVSFSLLKNTFGSASNQIRLSEFMASSLGDLGQSSNVGSLINKNLPDPVVSVSTPLTVVSNVYDTSSTTLTLGSPFQFLKRTNQKYTVSASTISFNQNPFNPQLTTFIANSTSNTIVNGKPQSTFEYTNTHVPIKVNIKKRNNLEKEVYTSTVNASQIVTPYQMILDTNIPITPATVSQQKHHTTHHNHNHNHTIHHDLPGGYGARHQHSIHHWKHHNTNHVVPYTFYQHYQTSRGEPRLVSHNSDLTNPVTYFNFVSVFDSTSSCTGESSYNKTNGCVSRYSVRITLPWSNTTLSSNTKTSSQLTYSEKTTQP